MSPTLSITSDGMLLEKTLLCRAWVMSYDTASRRAVFWLWAALSEFLWLCLISLERLCDVYHLDLKAATYITSFVELILNHSTLCYRNNKEQVLLTNAYWTIQIYLLRVIEGHTVSWTLYIPASVDYHTVTALVLFYC